MLRPSFYQLMRQIFKRKINFEFINFKQSSIDYCFQNKHKFQSQLILLQYKVPLTFCIIQLKLKQNKKGSVAKNLRKAHKFIDNKQKSKYPKKEVYVFPYLIVLKFPPAEGNKCIPINCVMIEKTKTQVIVEKPAQNGQFSL